MRYLLQGKSFRSRVVAWITVIVSVLSWKVPERDKDEEMGSGGSQAKDGYYYAASAIFRHLLFTIVVVS